MTVSSRVSTACFEKMVMRTATGLGIIGTCIYFVLLFGVGNKSVYVAVLLIGLAISLPVAYARKNELLETACLLRNYADKHWMLMSFLLILFTGYVIYGSSPIESYDTLTKHLPITLYAVENGQWYTDITESIVYGEPMVHQYTYSVLFVSVGANKALVLFNVVLLFSVYCILCYFVRSIYENASLSILAIIILTTPFFFQFSTIFYLEMLPLFFLFSAFVGVGKMETQNIWNNIEIISLICGFSLFVKLTHVLTLVVMAMVLIISCVIIQRSH